MLVTLLAIVITMKTDRHGQAKILTFDEIQRLFEAGFTCDRDRALFGICLYTACRIKEACTLLSTDVYDAGGNAEFGQNSTLRLKAASCLVCKELSRKQEKSHNLSDWGTP